MRPQQHLIEIISGKDILKFSKLSSSSGKKKICLIPFILNAGLPFNYSEYRKGEKYDRIILFTDGLTPVHAASFAAALKPEGHLIFCGAMQRSYARSTGGPVIEELRSILAQMSFTLKRSYTGNGIWVLRATAKKEHIKNEDEKYSAFPFSLTDREIVSEHTELLFERCGIEKTVILFDGLRLKERPTVDLRNILALKGERIMTAPFLVNGPEIHELKKAFRILLAGGNELFIPFMKKSYLSAAFEGRCVKNGNGYLYMRECIPEEDATYCFITRRQGANSQHEAVLLMYRRPEELLPHPVLLSETEYFNIYGVKLKA